MKILFIQPTGDKRGHYGYWTSKLCQAIAKQGHELCLFTNKIDTEKFLNEAPRFKIIELNNGQYRFDQYDEAMEKKSMRYWYGYFSYTYHIVKNALMRCQKEKFDAIFLTDVEYLTATLLLKRFKHALPPIIWHVQAANFSYDSYSGSIPKKIYKVFQRAIFKSVLKREVNGFAVLGEFHKQTLKKQLALDDSFPIEIIPDGADTNPIKIPQEEARKNIVLDYQGNLFLFLGMLRKDKGIEYLIEAAARLKGQDCKIVIAGAPFEWSAEEIKTLVAKHDVSSIIELRLGYIPDNQIASYYFASDVVVFPYTHIYTGGCGPLIKGASTHGKPVIVTNVADMSRVVQANGNGLISEACHPGSLAEQMLQFMSLSKEARQTMSENAYQLAKSYSWENVATKLTEFLGGIPHYASTKSY